MSSEGQNTSSSPQKKCGQPRTPCSWPSCQSATTAARGGTSSGMTMPSSRAMSCERALVRDVPAFLEEGISEHETDSLTDLEVSAVGPVGQSESLECRVREPIDVEVTEEVRSDLLSKFIGMLPGDRRVEGRPFTNSEWPGPDPDREVGADTV